MDSIRRGSIRAYAMVNGRFNRLVQRLTQYQPSAGSTTTSATSITE